MIALGTVAIGMELIATTSQIYVQLFDNPSCAKDVLSTGKKSVFGNPDKTMSRHAGLSTEEEKKAKKRAKKAQQKQEEQKKGAVWTT
jgi:deoxycytidylate deaminase